MAWVLEHPAVTSAIIGPRTMDQMTDLLAGADTRLEVGILDRIDELVPPGTTVTTPRHQVDVVVAEYGAAELRGRSTRERAAALAGIAHPDFRDGLHAAVATLR